MLVLTNHRASTMNLAPITKTFGYWAKIYIYIFINKYIDLYYIIYSSYYIIYTHVFYVISRRHTRHTQKFIDSGHSNTTGFSYAKKLYWSHVVHLMTQGKPTTIRQPMQPNGGKLPKLLCSHMATSSNELPSTWKIWRPTQCGKIQMWPRFPGMPRLKCQPVQGNQGM